MKEEFEKMAAAGKIRAGDVDPLVRMATEGFCMHKSWGFGQVKTVDVVLGKMTVDFASRPGHAIDLAFAPKILTPISKEHIEARKSTEMESLKQLAALHHYQVIKVIIDSYGNLATSEKVQEVLVPDVIDQDDYKKWWETARREMKKDGHFKLPTKKSEPIEYHAQDIPLQERLLLDFNNARGLKARLAVVAEIAKSARDLEDAATIAASTLEKLNEEITNHARTKPGLAHFRPAAATRKKSGRRFKRPIGVMSVKRRGVCALWRGAAKECGGRRRISYGSEIRADACARYCWAETFASMACLRQISSAGPKLRCGRMCLLWKSPLYTDLKGQSQCWQPNMSQFCPITGNRRGNHIRASLLTFG